MPPPLFADLFKTSNDLFVKDYRDISKKLETSVGLVDGASLKATFTQNENDISSELELKKKIFNFDVTGKVNAKNVKTLIVENTSLVPNLKLRIEHLLLTSTKASAEYKLKQITASGNYDAGKNTGEVSAVTQQSGLSVGVSQPIGSGKDKEGKDTSIFLNPVFKAQYNAESFEVGASVEDYGKKIGLTMYQTVNKTLGVGVSVDQSANKLNLALGGAFVPDSDTSLRGKVDSDGIVSALYTQKLSPEATLKLLGQVNTQKLAEGGAHKFGLNILFKV